MSPQQSDNIPENVLEAVYFESDRLTVGRANWNEIVLFTPIAILAVVWLCRLPFGCSDRYSSLRIPNISDLNDENISDSMHL
jgi:hypothetical protein